MESESCFPAPSSLHGFLLELDINGIDAYDSQFLLTFDTNPIILNRVKETLRADPLVVRWTVLKKGSAM